MTGRVCNKHGVPEYCPDGVCRWCEPEPTTSEWLINWNAGKAISDYAQLLGPPPKFMGLPVVVDQTLGPDEFRFGPPPARGPWDELLDKLAERIARIIVKHQGVEESRLDELKRLYPSFKP